MSTLEKHTSLANSAPLEFRLSEKIWNIDFTPLYKSSLGDPSITLVPGSLAQVKAFFKKYEKEMKREVSGPQFTQADFRASRENYYTYVADIFFFIHQHKEVGIFIGNAIDWTSYYLRYAWIDPAFRGQGVIPNFFSQLASLLKATGVDRIEGDVCPTNAISMQMFNRLGYQVTGYTLSNKWGALVKIVKFLPETEETLFQTQFCALTSKVSGRVGLDQQ